MMGYLSKEAYDRKREWAARKHERQKAITSLTEEQHDALAEICGIRHELHTHQEALFYTGSADHSRLWDNFPNEASEGYINELLESVGLETIHFPVTQIDFPDDYTWDEDGFDSWEAAYEKAMDMAEQLNDAIEAYLSNIDAQHGTEYAPSGATRIY